MGRALFQKICHNKDTPHIKKKHRPEIDYPYRKIIGPYEKEKIKENGGVE